jgi:hypothetical protein
VDRVHGLQCAWSMSVFKQGGVHPPIYSSYYTNRTGILGSNPGRRDLDGWLIVDRRLVTAHRDRMTALSGHFTGEKGGNGYDGQTTAGIGLKWSVGHDDPHPRLLGWWRSPDNARDSGAGP